jgi:hypothetical protein
MLTGWEAQAKKWGGKRNGWMATQLARAKTYQNF